MVGFEGEESNGDALVGNGEEDQDGRGEKSDAAGEGVEEEGEKENMPSRHGPNADEFDGAGGGPVGNHHDGLGGEQDAPEKEVRPVHGAAVGGVVHEGVAEAPAAGGDEVAGVGEPDIGVVFEEEAGFGDAGDGVGRDGAGGERAGGAVGVEGQEDDEEGEGKEEERGEPSGEGACWRRKVHGGSEG